MIEMATSRTAASQKELVVPSQESVVLDLNARRRPALDAQDARVLTDEINQTKLRLWLLVSEAHDRRAHLALGYETWDDYVRAEFRMSPSRAYQWIDTGHVMRALAKAGVDIDHVDPPTVRVVAQIKSRLPEVQRIAKRAIARGDAVDPLLRELAKKTRINDAEERPRRPRTAIPADPASLDLVQCPACVGTGQVVPTSADAIRVFMAKNQK